MIIKQQMLLDFLGTPDVQLIIPVYQRVYAWGARQCDGLFDDIMRAGRAERTHFVGTVLYVPELGAAGVGTRFDVIDGQQRLATLTLLLAALRDYVRDAGYALEGVDAAGIDQRFLHVDGVEGVGKLVLSRADRATLEAVIAGAELPGEDDVSANVVANYEHFRARMREGFAADEAQVLWRGMQQLLVITAELDGEDRPQVVFESLNSKGMPLTTADLVRNLMLVSVGYDEQTRLYERYWAPIERLFGDDPGGVRLNAALHGWLAVTAPRLHVGSADEVYGAFKTYLEDLHTGTLEELLIGLKGFCETFAAKSQDSGAARATAHATWGNGKVEGIISERKLFGD
ncbi:MULTISPECIES: DUF262 domain-containing protein [Gordonibacter]|uniref:DUF262 domain-containing protein n=1 Tax=Gordonibacter faecis TaxID=3047475 RepID=A0ABT7DMH3_9ACTN|nr:MULTISPECIES: DUF262 domain-containing protein [unclassified Gordonibacter]MDJ1650587.1 DUF262 domain-containing protein [Gordonibacter sp. KGMB12511]HIW75755.1 DUF262 domain-containing protein [Candidatus Gordonibacter avicola]